MSKTSIWYIKQHEVIISVEGSPIRNHYRYNFFKIIN